MQAVLGQELLDRLAPSEALDRDQHPRRRRRQQRRQRAQRIFGMTIDADIGRRSRGRRCRGAAELDVDPRERLDRAEEFVDRGEQIRRRQQRPCVIAAQQPVAALGFFPECVQRAFDVTVQAHDCRCRQVFGKPRRMLEKERQVILDAARRDAVADILVQLRLRGIAFEQFAETLPEARAAGVIERKFARRQQPDLVHRIDCPLGVDVERAQRLDLVAEEVDPIGDRRAHRKQIDEPAADTVFARRNDLRDVRVAGERHLLAQLLDIERLAFFQEEREPRQVGKAAVA